MIEIKTVDDLIEHCIELALRMNNFSKYSDEYDPYEGQSIAYEDMLEKAKKLKTNMKKQDD